ncbi:MAG: hypothetical protein R3B90_01760 [Planctomycetaceae bacterium]
MLRACWLTGCLLLTATFICRAEEPRATPTDQLATATHKQIRSIRPKHDGQTVSLNTFCVDRQGNVLACVGGSTFAYPQAGDRSARPARGNFVQVYSPEGELTAEWDVPFQPTAINIAKDETIFVAGAGQLARFSPKGELLTQADLPQVQESEESRQQAADAAKQQAEEILARMQKQATYAKEQAEKLSEIPEGERTAAQTARLKAYERQQTLYQLQIEQLQERAANVVPQTIAPSRSSGEVKALAVSDEHVFVCTRAGTGYEVVRCDYDFQNPKQVLSGLRGCCGQMDIQAFGQQVFVAENTKFRVGIHDEDGKFVDSFGSQDRTGKTGFGSCCNPMNVRCCSNGDVLTAESSIGDIKRFSPTGDFLGYVGRARISGGCKHVAIGCDEQRDRYYMMNISDNTICVLVPLDEAPEFTEYELAAKEAREGLGRQLVGEWRIPGSKAKVRTKPKSALGSALSSLFGSSGEPAGAENANAPFTAVTFGEDGKLGIAGGMYGQWGIDDWTWSPVSQNSQERTVDFEMLTGGTQYVTLRVRLVTDNEAEIATLAGGQPAEWVRFERVVAEVEQVEEATKAEAAAEATSDAELEQPMTTEVSQPAEVAKPAIAVPEVEIE